MQGPSHQSESRPLQPGLQQYPVHHLRRLTLDEPVAQHMKPAIPDLARYRSHHPLRRVQRQPQRPVAVKTEVAADVLGIKAVIDQRSRAELHRIGKSVGTIDSSPRKTQELLPHDRQIPCKNEIPAGGERL